MKRLHAVGLAIVLALPLSAQAAYNPGSATCSGNLSVNLDGQVALRCEGNLSLSGGDITSAHSLLIEASGDLLLQAIALTSPVITLQAGTQLYLGTDVVLKDPQTPFGAPPALTLSLHGQVLPLPELVPSHNGKVTSTINLAVTPVPEPATGALVAAGLATAALAFRRGRPA